MTPTSSPFFRDQIVGADDIVHLYSGAEAPSLRTQAEAAQRYLTDKSDGEAGRRNAEAEITACRKLLARLIAGDPDKIAFLGNASDALHRLVDAVDIGPGDNVVTSDLEFPSGVLTLLALRERGVQVRIVRAVDGELPVDVFRKAIDERTRVVLASHVSYAAGARVDARMLRAVANAVGAPLILDVTQSLGVLRVHAQDADALVSSTYKWLFGPHGLGLVHLTDASAFSDARMPAGWRGVDDLFGTDRLERIHRRTDGQRLELGFPSFPSVYLLRPALAMICASPTDAVEAHAMAVSEHLVDGLRAIGAELLTPANPANRGTNISVAAEHGERIAETMLRNHVRVWGGDGRVRFSVHAFNSVSDIDSALRAYGAAR